MRVCGACPEFADPRDGGRDSKRGQVVGADLDEEAAGVADAGIEHSVQQERFMVAAEGA